MYNIQVLLSWKCLKVPKESGWLNELGSWFTQQLIQAYHAQLCKLQKRCTRLAVPSDKEYQFLAHGRWFTPGTHASSTTKTGHHDIAEILLKVVLNTKNQSINNDTNDFKGSQISYIAIKYSTN